MAQRRIKAFASHAQAFHRRGRIPSRQHAPSGGEAQKTAPDIRLRYAGFRCFPSFRNSLRGDGMIQPLDPLLALPLPEIR
jgi:hypothetical protein